jgi:pimeloyl-ACP methyl ester carboxylesterase
MGERWVAVENGELPFIEAGAGPHVLFCHAGVADMSMWKPQLDQLRTEFHVAAYDARGYGRSQSQAGTYSPVADLEAVADSLDGPVALVGCSMGAAAALEYASAHPDRVWAVGWVCGGIWGAERAMDETEAAFDARRREYLLARDWPSLAKADAAFWVDGPRTPGRAPDHVREQVGAMILRNLERPDDDLELDFEPRPKLARLQAIACPVLLVVGQFDATSVAQAAAMLALLLPRAREVSVPTAHVPSMEIPGQFGVLLRDFLWSAARETGAR